MIPFVHLRTLSCNRHADCGMLKNVNTYIHTYIHTYIYVVCQKLGAYSASVWFMPCMHFLVINYKQNLYRRQAGTHGNNVRSFPYRHTRCPLSWTGDKSTCMSPTYHIYHFYSKIVGYWSVEILGWENIFLEEKLTDIFWQVFITFILTLCNLLQ